MESPIVRFEFEGPVGTIVMDDGERNVISPQMLRDLNNALNLAEKKQSVVVLTGREEIFCAGFDLKILRSGVIDAYKMLCGGFELAYRLLSFPTPVVIACNGHAIAMGAFLLLAGDYRIAPTGPFRIVANEVAIGLTMPFAAIEICRQRLEPVHFVRAVLLSENYTPETAVEAGFLDRIVPAGDFLREATEVATQLAKLDMNAHYQTKLRARHQMLKALRKAIRSDRRDFIMKGTQRILKKIMRK
ncbi:MAG: crotonase/enoyl-CoA hydratase family protein [Thermodesulfobacteriota bacterium]